MKWKKWISRLALSAMMLTALPVAQAMDYTWYMNAWVQACIWRYQQGSMSDPVTACAEELMAVYNSLEGTHYTNIDEELDGRSFRDRTQFIIDGGTNLWGDCKVYQYNFTGAGSSTHSAGSVQKVILGELTPTTTTSDKYKLIVKKVDSSNPSKGLAGAGFHVQSENGSFSKDIVTGADGTYTIEELEAGTYAVTETTPPPGGYEIDNPGPQYLALFFGVMVFILCGFEHCVANMYYFSIAGLWSPKAVLYILVMTAGNSVGGIFMPSLRNWMISAKA